ncbi:FAD-dependent oxidoreductase [Arachnia propionica]|nr:FAD-dependent oxidoreductase [Arachnia propionica]MDO5083676.1 FAD-dependent oxidoreductase [Arachnia propionica]
MYDVIVIGSGIGGLTAAGLLAGVAGKRVLVLEKHSEPGGQTHTFRRGGASWDVGVHYVGAMSPGEDPRLLSDFLSAGELGWNRMPEEFDRYVYPDFELRPIADETEYFSRLVELFPAEKQAIERWFTDVKKARRWLQLGFVSQMLPARAAAKMRLAQRLTGRLGTMTTRGWLDQHVRDVRLKALLASQWGDYGVPPAKSAFAMHALIFDHYLKGAWFPAGGSSRIARTFEAGIEAAGGAVRVEQEVIDIRVENGRVTGVHVRDLRSNTHDHEQTYLAPVVISAVGARNTFNKLMPSTHDTKHLTAPLRDQVDQLGVGDSAVVAYIRFREDPRVIGVDGSSIRVFGDHHHDDTPTHVQNLLDGRATEGFISFPSVKAGQPVHTAEIVTSAPYAAFQQWRKRGVRNRGADYDALKQRIGDGLVALADRVLPGFRDLVEHVEVSTPLTAEHYTSHPWGAFFGLPATPDRLRMKPLGPRTPIPGLYLAGQDAMSLGVVGAMMGGVAAASQVLGSRGYPRIMKAVRAGRAPLRTDGPLPQGRFRARVVLSRELTPSVQELTVEIDGEVGTWVPGQFARLLVAPHEWRDYSIVGLEEGRLRLLISTATGGLGSRFAASARPGTPLRVELPLGRFQAFPSNRRRLFVATGTGLAPFLPMFADLMQEDDLLVFGCRTAAEDLTTLLTDPLPSTIRCISREAVPGARHGRVTTELSKLDLDWRRTEVYLSGSDAMIVDATRLLHQKGVTFLRTEPY